MKRGQPMSALVDKQLGEFKSNFRTVLDARGASPRT